MDFHQNPISSGSDIRLCIFLSTSVCVGLLALVWAFRHMQCHRGQISVVIVILLFGDLIEVILDLYTVAKLLQKIYWSPYMVVQFLSGLHLCAFILHQLVALEGLKYPQCSAHILSCPLHHDICSCACFFNCEYIHFQLLDPWIHL